MSREKLAIMPNFLGSRISYVRGELKKSQTEFAELLGFSDPATVSKWEANKREPDLPTLRKIAALVGKDMNWLLSESEVNTSIIKDKQKGYRIPGQLEYKLESTIPAGDGDIVDLTDWYHSDVLDYDPQHHFFLKVDEQFGLSMMPLIRPGDLLLCSTRAKVKSGDIVAAKWDKNKGAVKIASFPKNDTLNVLLMSYNQAYEPFSVPKKQTKMYKVVLIKKS